LVHLGYGGHRAYKVVGYFSAAGGPLESEIWGHLPSLMNAYNRDMYSSASLLLREDIPPKSAIEQIKGPAVELDAQTETDYWRAQSKLIRVYLGVSQALVGIMTLAAMLSIANTMFAAAAGRTREIAMLRTIGFSRGGILSGFVIEAVLLSLMGGLLGCLGGALWTTLLGRTKDMYGQSTFTTLAFDVRFTPMTIGWALLSVVIVGAIGALWPATRAANIAVVEALRDA
jgi:ABC-type antimicrobial peptide transport system permease subunit